MTSEEKLNAIEISRKMHDQIEAAYLKLRESVNDASKKELERYLLADMAMHLFQTAISPKEINMENLRNNVHAIATISERFIPQLNISNSTRELF